MPTSTLEQVEFGAMIGEMLEKQARGLLADAALYSNPYTGVPTAAYDTYKNLRAGKYMGALGSAAGGALSLVGGNLIGSGLKSMGAQMARWGGRAATNPGVMGAAGRAAQTVGRGMFRAPGAINAAGKAVGNAVSTGAKQVGGGLFQAGANAATRGGVQGAVGNAAMQAGKVIAKAPGQAAQAAARVVQPAQTAINTMNRGAGRAMQMSGKGVGTQVLNSMTRNPLQTIAGYHNSQHNQTPTAGQPVQAKVAFAPQPPQPPPGAMTTVGAPPKLPVGPGGSAQTGADWLRQQYNFDGANPGKPKWNPAAAGGPQLYDLHKAKQLDKAPPPKPVNPALEQHMKKMRQWAMGPMFGTKPPVFNSQPSIGGVVNDALRKVSPPVGIPQPPTGGNI